MQSNSKVLLINHEKCTGCRLCEQVCAVRHHGASNPSRSRIRVMKWEMEGLYVPVSCQQCQDAPCLNGCPVGAISRNEELNRVEVDYDLCIGCRTCLEVCTNGALILTEAGLAIDRDLCRKADLLEHERVDIYNVNTGARFSTYVLYGEKGVIGVNGAAARADGPDAARSRREPVELPFPNRRRFSPIMTVSPPARSKAISLTPRKYRTSTASPATAVSGPLTAFCPRFQSACRIMAMTTGFMP